LNAVKLLPKEDLAKVARIEGPGGAPVPERWYILVHSPSSETGLKEFVVANGELVAARQVSQFAERLSSDDVVGAQSIKFDSNKLAKLASEYAEANELAFHTINYRLGKDTAEAQPLWRITCLSETGDVVGTLIVTTSTGKVISSEGFPVKPGLKGRVQRKVTFRTEAQPEVAVADSPVDINSDADEPEPTAESTSVSSRSKESSVPRSQQGSRDRRVRRSDPVGTVRDVTRPVRRTIGRFLPF
jgi:hypothetical protein